MNLHHLLSLRASTQGPIKVGILGVGKFARMFLAQARQLPGIHVVAAADLAVSAARRAFITVGWPSEQVAADSVTKAGKQGGTFICDDPYQVIESNGVEVVVDATGDPAAGTVHALACCDNGKHLIMANVEADALAGPLLAREAQASGITYSLAYGDQPALVCELVDWARTAGFDVIAAGKGTKYLPSYHGSTPDTVWDLYGLTPYQARRDGLNAKMFNSFIDGTKSAIEMAATANATGLNAPSRGLAFPPCGVDDLPQLMRASASGGVLEGDGQVEVISSLERDGRPVARDLRWGVYVTFQAPTEYAARCFTEYGLVTDDSGQFAAMYRPYHLIGLELAVSVASVAIRGEPTGAPVQFAGDVVAIAKRDLSAGDCLDGEGGYTVWGKLKPAAESLATRALPIGVCSGLKLRQRVSAGEQLHWDDVIVNEDDAAISIRRRMERMFAETVPARHFP